MPTKPPREIMSESKKDLPRVYGEQDIGRILKRATELQHEEPSAPAAAGVTLAELEEIAAEAGIDPKYLRRAALEVDSGVSNKTFWSEFCGEELVLVREMPIPGELPDDGFERIVAAIQSHSRDYGQPNLLGRTLTWRAETASKTRTIQVVVTSRDGETSIRLDENLTQLASGLFAGMSAGFGVGGGIGFGLPLALAVFGSPLLGVLTPLSFIGLTIIGTREIYRRVVKKRRKAINELFERTVREAEASIASVTVGAPDSPAGALESGDG